MRNTINRSAGVVCALLVVIVAGAIGQAGSREIPAYGIFSNMQVSDGDYSGFEFIILPSNDGDFVVFQQAEGWPQKPLLLAARLGGTRATDKNGLQFDHPEMGPFRGVILGDSLVGEFTRMKYQITLLRGQSVWQSPQHSGEATDMANNDHIHHAINYIEFSVTDMAQSKRFYEAAFDWRFNDYGPDYAGIQKQDGEAGGLRLEPEVSAGGPLVILYSNDLGTSLTRVRQAGGQIIKEPYAFPGGRRFHFQDPSGNELAVWSEK